MSKYTASVIIAVSFLSAGIASAQSYYPSTSGGCVTITRDLSYGARGSDVSALQSYLVSQNYPGGGSWMVTGYFGTATQAAVRIYQSYHNLAQTGMADAATRASIASCGASYPTPTYPSYPTYPTYPSYPTYPIYPNPYGTVTLSSLSPTSASVGSTVTIYGSGFDYTNNVVRVGNATAGTTASYNGTTLTFTVPYTTTGYNQVSVTNSRGTSNALSLSITEPIVCGGYGYVGCCGYGYQSQCQQGQLSLSYLSPNSGAVGSTVTIFGSGFSQSNNSVRFGNGIIAGIGSIDGRSLSFTVPSTLSGYGSQLVTLGSYNVSVTNATGAQSNVLPFTVTSLGSAGAPTILSQNGPTSVSTGATNTWTVTVNNPSSQNVTLSVNWGDQNVYGTQTSAPQNAYVQGQSTFSFQHIYTQTGTYTITFTVSNPQGQQNVATMTVTVSGTNQGQPVLNYMTPTSGMTGTLVTLTGSGFTNDNTVRFGVGGQMHVPSYNGNTIYYTIPSSVSPCDVNTAGNYCATYQQQVTPGTYQIYVTNSQGTTNQLSFTVTGSNNSGTITLSYASPNAASNGSWVTLYGSGFTGSNTVTLTGNGRTFSAGSPVYAQSNTSLSFQLTSCPSSTPNCPGYYITPGTYPLTVNNQLGTSNGISFTVTQ
jgi:hypothetical protein